MICGVLSQDKGISSGETELPKTIETPKSEADINKQETTAEAVAEEDTSFLGNQGVTITGISPAHGPTNGETRVVVRGGPFGRYMKLYPDPKCRFGSDDKQVSATYVSCPEKALKYFEKEGKKANRTKICI
jgi:hypothetical protein